MTSGEEGRLGPREGTSGMTEMSCLRSHAVPVTQVHTFSKLVRLFTGHLFAVCELYFNSNNFLKRTMDLRIKITLNSIKSNLKGSES